MLCELEGSSSLAGGTQPCPVGPVFAVGIVSSAAFGQIFPFTQVVSSHSGTDRHSTEDLRGPSVALRIFLYVAFYYLVLSPKNSQHLDLFELPTPSS